ncbi:MAG: hypothetical protein IM536_10845 [Pseudanabaena sp. M34BS1SP1A06MG]|nr:hypothetical protein [Pseudanabaena sp. M34BS1SP1A06MG]
MYQIQFFSAKHNRWFLMWHRGEESLARLTRLFEVMCYFEPRIKPRIIDLNTGAIVYT